MLYNTNIFGMKLQFDSKTKNLVINDEKTLTGAEMQEIATESRGQNRIHKPVALLFWMDCKNGKSGNYDLI